MPSILPSSISLAVIVCVCVLTLRFDSFKSFFYIILKSDVQLSRFSKRLDIRTKLQNTCFFRFAVFRRKFKSSKKTFQICFFSQSKHIFFFTDADRASNWITERKIGICRFFFTYTLKRWAQGWKREKNLRRKCEEEENGRNKVGAAALENWP